MSESPQHLRLVEKIRDIIRKRNDVTPTLVLAEDHRENTTTFLTDEGFHPDLYYVDNNLIILGEAKTSNDLCNRHSYAQFDSYIKHLQTATNDSMKAVLYIGVPWADFRWTKRYFQKIKHTSIEVIIVNDFGYEEKI